MTLYNIEKLEALKEEFIYSLKDENNYLWSAYSDASNRFIDFLKEKEKASSFDPNQLEMPFPDEDNSK